MSATLAKTVPVTFNIPANRLGPRSRQVLEIAIANPKLSHAAIAKRLGVSPSRIDNIFRSLRFLNLLKTRARMTMTSMIPRAVYAFGQCIDQTQSWGTKLEASMRLLEDQSVVGREGMDLTVTNRYDSMLPSELFTIVQNAKPIDVPIVEGNAIE